MTKETAEQNRQRAIWMRLEGKAAESEAFSTQTGKHNKTGRSSARQPATPRNKGEKQKKMNPTNLYEFQQRGHGGRNNRPRVAPQPPNDSDYIFGCEEQAEAASRLLPAWFIPRMMTDQWSFGLTLVTGVTLAISSILDVQQAADGSIWLDVRMLNCEEARDLPQGDAPNWKLLASPTKERTTASIAAAYVVAAVELAYT